MHYSSSHSGFNTQSEDGKQYVYLPKDSKVQVTYEYEAFEADGSDTNWRTCNYKSGDECRYQSGKQTFTIDTSLNTRAGYTNFQKVDLKKTGSDPGGTHRPYFQWKLVGPLRN